MHIIALVGSVTYGNVMYLTIKAQRQCEDNTGVRKLVIKKK